MPNIAVAIEYVLATEVVEQHAIEINFSFLKDDQIVSALFLKCPERIEALGLILPISLLLWRLIELVMRIPQGCGKCVLGSGGKQKKASVATLATEALLGSRRSGF